jgi:hypothetical protein
VSTLAYDSFIHAKNIPGTDPLVPIKIRLEKNDLNSYKNSSKYFVRYIMSVTVSGGISEVS